MVLITNDDGFDAEGLQALSRASKSAFPNQPHRIVAPATQQSMVGHRVTTDRPIEVFEDDNGIVRVSGTPADCVRIAIYGLGLRPTLVLAGVNHGGNMGQDIPISGTVAAVREACYHGILGVAFSQYLRHGVSPDWAAAEVAIIQVLKSLPPESQSEQGYSPPAWNVNLPSLDSGSVAPRIIETSPCLAPLPVSFDETNSGGANALRSFIYSGSYPDRPKNTGTDVATCFGGDISVSRLKLPF